MFETLAIFNSSLQCCHPKFKFELFYKMPGKKETKSTQKLCITKNSRSRAWQEKEDTGNAMVNCLGRQGRLGLQNLTKEYLAALCASMLRRITGFVKSGGDW